MFAKIKNSHKNHCLFWLVESLVTIVFHLNVSIFCLVCPYFISHRSSLSINHKHSSEA